MRRLTIRSFDFASFLKLYVVGAASLGIAVGLLAFLGSLVGMETRLNFFGISLNGVAGGIGFIFFAPAFMGLGGVFGAIAAFLPFKWWLKSLGGVIIFADLKGADVAVPSIPLSQEV